MTRKELYDNLEYITKRALDYAQKKTGESRSNMEEEGYWKDFGVRETRAG